MEKMVLLIITILALSACCKEEGKNTFSTFNDGQYEFVKFKSKGLAKQNSALIFGKIQDLRNEEYSMNGILQLWCERISVVNGQYTYKSKPFDINSQLRAVSVGYLTVETKPFKLTKGDSLQVNFYLVEDMRSLFNCEGQ